MFVDSFRRRMLPMYVAKFLWNLVLWYSIEKIFMVSIGFNNETIALMVAVYAAMSVIMEVPSGILADRWSRKGVLTLGALCLTIASLLGGLSDSVGFYIIAMVFWGFFDALNSGTDSAIVYDTLIEERGSAKDYEKEYGLYQAVGGVALFVSGLGGGIIASILEPRDTFFITVPIVLVACIVMLLFRDSHAHKQTQEAQVGKHIKATFSAILRNPNLIWVMVTMFAISLANGLVGEMYQLWYIAIAAPVVYFGVVGALINATWGFGGVFARFLTRKRTLVMAIGIVLVSAATLAFTRNPVILLIAQFLFMILANATWVVMTGQMHRQLPSSVRAGAGSAANTMMRLVNIPLVLLFGWIAHHYDIFTAAWILVILVAIALISELNSRFRKRPRIVEL